MNNRINIFLTGATGILGSHILFELLYLYSNGIWTGKIVLLVRPTKNHSSEQRIRQILSNQYLPNRIKMIPIGELLSHILIIDSGLKDFSISKLPAGISDYRVIHAAASVNLGRNESTEHEINQNNYQGTIHLLKEIAPKTNKFIFVSTAYSSGHRTGEINNDFFSMGEYNFRNHYEYYKHQTEKYVKSFCSDKGIDWQILRPSILCGRSVDAPLYVIPRFLVFYLFARYALNLRTRLDNTFLNIHVPSQAYINIVPVDYVAKITIASINEPIQQLNIVHNSNVACRTLFEKGFDLIGYYSYSFCEDMPRKITPIEKFLYATIGQQLGPYMDTPKHHFNTAPLHKLLPNINIPQTEDIFNELLEFAASRNFVPLY